MSRVLQNLQLSFPHTRFVAIAGTNGKGSTLAFLESIYRAAGYRVGSYTSPHLLRYNERIRIDANDVDDASLCQAFARVEAARGDIPLTYFEFGTLAALLIISQQAPDLGLLETGLGGRLDAVNIIDADVAVITSVAIDHTEWLGDTREQIGREKAGIFREGRPAVCADPVPPDSVVATAAGIAAPFYCLGRDFTYAVHAGEWQWQWAARSRNLGHLPMPGLPGEHQLANASAALAVVELLHPVLPVDESAMASGLRAPKMHGRLEVIDSGPQVLLDVSHNPESVAAMGRYLAAQPCAGKTWAILGMLRDKDIQQSLRSVLRLIDHWYLVDLPGPRGTSATDLAEQLASLKVQAPVECHADASTALQIARQQASIEDRIVVFGSFLTVGAIMAQIPTR